MAGKPFEDSRVRIQWAKEGLADLERCGDAYFDREPYQFVIDPEPDGIYERHKIRFEPLPSALTKHTVHAVEDLRSALDISTCDVARLKNLPLENVHFPFCAKASDLKSRLNSSCKDFPEEITNLFASYEPYAGGSNLLFAINELCNASKHRIIVPVAFAIGVNLPFIETSSTNLHLPIRIFEGYNSEENEITYAITQRGLDWQYHSQFSFDIRFGEVGVIEGRSVRDDVAAMIRAVTTIVDEIESESRNLGFAV